MIAAEPGHEEARAGEAAALGGQGRYGEARSRLEEGLARLPRSGVLAHALARLLASCPDRTLRDGPRALELAMAVHEAQPRPEHAWPPLVPR